MKRVLVLTYYWPPSGGPGVQRILKFCRYLKDFGWEPIVITVRDGSYPSLDPSLEDDVPSDLQVRKTNTFEPFRLFNLLQGKKGNSVPIAMAGIKESKSLLKRFSLYVRANFFIPDARVGWMPYASREAVKVIGSQKIHAILTTGPPHSTHLAGMGLKKRFNIPWVADFRDPWVNVFYNQGLPRTRRSWARDQRLEDQAVTQADALVTVSDGMKLEFEDRAQDLRVIYNGYDPADMDLSDQQGPDEYFRLAYIGNFIESQSVPALWEALGNLIRENEDFARFFRLDLTGHLAPALEEAFTQHGLSDHVEQHDYVPHKEATRKMRAVTTLLFIIPKAPDNHLILTGKLFEYLACGTPLFSIGPVSGNAARLLVEADRSPMLDYQDQQAIQAQLLAQFEHWLESGKKLKRLSSNSTIEKYSRKGQTGVLAGLLDQVYQKHSSV